MMERKKVIWFAIFAVLLLGALWWFTAEIVSVLTTVWEVLQWLLATLTSFFADTITVTVILLFTVVALSSLWVRHYARKHNVRYIEAVASLPVILWKKIFYAMTVGPIVTIVVLGYGTWEPKTVVSLLFIGWAISLFSFWVFRYQSVTLQVKEPPETGVYKFAGVLTTVTVPNPGGTYPVLDFGRHRNEEEQRQLPILYRLIELVRIPRLRDNHDLALVGFYVSAADETGEINRVRGEGAVGPAIGVFVSMNILPDMTRLSQAFQIGAFTSTPTKCVQKVTDDMLRGETGLYHLLHHDADLNGMHDQALDRIRKALLSHLEGVAWTEAVQDNEKATAAILESITTFPRNENESAESYVARAEKEAKTVGLRDNYGAGTLFFGVPITVTGWKLPADMEKALAKIQTAELDGKADVERTKKDIEQVRHVKDVDQTLDTREAWRLVLASEGHATVTENTVDAGPGVQRVVREIGAVITSAIRRP